MKKEKRPPVRIERASQGKKKGGHKRRGKRENRGRRGRSRSRR
jgi:hypothetical protein